MILIDSYKSARCNTIAHVCANICPSEACVFERESLWVWSETAAGLVKGRVRAVKAGTDVQFHNIFYSLHQSFCIRLKARLDRSGRH